MNLQSEFQKAWVSLGCRGDSALAWSARIREYSQPWRHHHTLDHIAHVVRELKLARHLIERLNEVIWAAIDHDRVNVPAVMGTRISDNELLSAQVSMLELKNAGVPHDIQIRIGLSIIATDGKPRIMSSDTQHLVDADRAILGQAWRTYQTYAGQIAREYLGCGVPIPVFQEGRRTFLRTINARTIYRTEHFQRMYEEDAHENIERELAFLE